MNAQGVKDQAHLNRLLSNTDYVGQEKLDGIRATIHVTKHGLRIFSRSAGVDDPTKPLEKTASLPHLAVMSYPRLLGTVLDAELLVPGVDAATIAGAVHSKQPNATTGLVHAFVFDVLRYKGEDLTTRPLQHRIGILEKLKFMIKSPSIVFLPWVFRTKDKQQLYDDILSRGGEGIMLKRLDATYLEGGRPANNWYKAKKSASFDVVCMGFTKGAGKFNGRIGALIFGQFVGGSLRELGQASGMSDAIRNEMSTFPDRYVGKVVTIKGMERLASGAIRHPIFVGMNPDKDPEQCIHYPGEQ